MKRFLPSFITYMLGEDGNKDEETVTNEVVPEQKSQTSKTCLKVLDYFRENIKISTDSSLVTRKAGRSSHLGFSSYKPGCFRRSLKESRSFTAFPTKLFDIPSYRELKSFQTKNEIEAIQNDIEMNHGSCCMFDNVEVDIEEEIENSNKQRQLTETNSMTNKCEVGSVLSKNCSEMEIDLENVTETVISRSPSEQKRFSAFYDAVEPISSECLEICELGNKSETKIEVESAEENKNSSEELSCSQNKVKSSSESVQIGSTNCSLINYNCESASSRERNEIIMSKETSTSEVPLKTLKKSESKSENSQNCNMFVNETDECHYPRLERLCNENAIVEQISDQEVNNDVNEVSKKDVDIKEQNSSEEEEDKTNAMKTSSKVSSESKAIASNTTDENKTYELGQSEKLKSVEIAPLSIKLLAPLVSSKSVKNEGDVCNKSSNNVKADFEANTEQNVASGCEVRTNASSEASNKDVSEDHSCSGSHRSDPSFKSLPSDETNSLNDLSEYSALTVTETEIRQLYEDLVSVSQNNLELSCNSYEVDQATTTLESKVSKQDLASTSQNNPNLDRNSDKIGETIARSKSKTSKENIVAADASNVQEQSTDEKTTEIVSKNSADLDTENIPKKSTCVLPVTSNKNSESSINNSNILQKEHVSQNNAYENSEEVSKTTKNESFITLYRRSNSSKASSKSNKSELQNTATKTPNKNVASSKVTSQKCDNQPNGQIDPETTVKSIKKTSILSSSLGSGFTDLQSDLKELDAISLKQNNYATDLTAETSLKSKHAAGKGIERENDTKLDININKKKAGKFTKEFFQEKIDGFMPIDPTKNLFQEFLEESSKRSKRASHIDKILSGNFKIDTNNGDVKSKLINSLTKVINGIKENNKTSQESNSSDESLLDIKTSKTAQLLSSYIFNKEGEEGYKKLLKEVASASRGAKRQSSHLSKPLFGTGKGTEEKRRCKTPYYICEKTRNSIILHRPIIIKPDDVSKMTSLKQREFNHRASRPQCMQVSAACKRKLNSDDDDAKTKKFKGLENDSTFIGVNSFFQNYSNLKHLSVVQQEDKDEDESQCDEI